MSNIEKKIHLFLLGALILSLLLPPFSLAARDPRSQRAQVEEGTRRAFCEVITRVSSEIVERLAEREGKLAQKRDEIEERWDEKRTARDARLEERRATWEENRQEHFAKLRERAQTDAQRQAVTDFVEALEAARGVRQTALEAARDAFWQGLKDFHASRKAAVDSAIAAFRSSVAAALESAKADCEAGEDPATVRENLQTSLKAAREKLVADIQAVEKIRTDTQALIEEFKAAVKEANEAFKASVQEALADLKEAFGE